METLTSDKGISLEDARELLMEISLSVPEKVPGPKALPKISSGTNVIKLNGGAGDEECRSKQVSIPYMQPGPEAVRDSLISISQSIPDEVSVPKMLLKISTGASVVESHERGGEEECRLKLISISHMQPPDMKFLLSSLESLTA